MRTYFRILVLSSQQIIPSPVNCATHSFVSPKVNANEKVKLSWQSDNTDNRAELGTNPGAVFIQLKCLDFLQELRWSRLAREERDKVETDGKICRYSKSIRVGKKKTLLPSYGVSLYLQPLVTRVTGNQLVLPAPVAGSRCRLSHKFNLHEGLIGCLP